jgi:hypothetical protein
MSAAIALERWPKLRDAVPPKPLERRNGTFRFNVADEWSMVIAQLERGEYRLRAPAVSIRGLCGPFNGRGACLEPLKREGDLAWIDPMMPAEDGDFVIVQWHPDTLRGIIERGRRKPEWLAMYGENPGDLATKWLRRNGNDFWLVCRESMIPLGASPFSGGENKILGVVRYVARNGVPLYGSGELVVAHEISQNAATSVYQIDDDGPLDFTCADLDNTERGWILYVAATVGETTDVIEVTASFGIDLTAVGTSPAVNVAVSYGDTGAPIGAANSSPKNAAGFEARSMVGTFTGLSAGTHRFGIEAKITHTFGGGATTVRVTNVEIQATVVKR